MASTARGLVINLNAYGATVRLDGGELAIAPESDVETHRAAYQRSLVRRKELDFEVRQDGRRTTVLLAPQIRDDELDDRIAEYLKSTQEWEDPEGAPAHERHFLSKKRRAALFYLEAHGRLSKHYAVISIGTNSTRVLLADVAPDIPHVDLARSIGTRIGEGLGQSGELGAEPMQRTYDAIRQLLRQVRGHYVKLFAVSTSAVRRATNGAEFAAGVQEILGIPLRVLSGEEEASAAYRGAITAFGALHGERVGVIDTGGGSTEYAVGIGPAPEQLASCEIGAVRLTEAVPELAGRDGVVDLTTIERARAIARKALAPIVDFPAVERLAFVGGTATTTAGIVRGRRAKVSSFSMSRADLQKVLVRMCGMSLKERKEIPGIKPQRADILPGGIIVLDTVLDIVKRDAAVATAADLLLGFLLQQRDAAAPAAHTHPPAKLRVH